MARVAQGYKIRWRKGRAFVRITHEGVRTENRLRATDPRSAQVEARARYAEVVAGRAISVATRAPLLDLVTKWIEARRPSLRPKTIALYETEMVPVVAHFKTLSRITDDSLFVYAERLLHERKASSIRVRISIVGTFLLWCRKHGFMSTRVELPKFARVEGTPAARQKQRHVTPLSADDVERILAAMPERTHHGNPCRARFRFQYETSLRPATIAKLEAPKHYRKGSDRLKITADIDKTGYARTVRLSAKAREAIDSVCPQVGKIFGSVSAYLIFRAAVAKAGLPADVVANASQYDLRHSRITNWLDATGDLTGTAQLAGHTQLTTTSRYAHQNEETGARVITGAKTGAVQKRSKKAR